MTSNDSGNAPRLDAASSDSGNSERDTQADTSVPESGSETEVAEICGDGRVTGTELCDTTIPEGRSGACPSSCTSSDPCLVYELEGSDCHAECVQVPVTCSSGDGCCPTFCNSTNDSDCSQSCGDGIVQSDIGETCEPASEATEAMELDPELICPTTCADDGDPCTEESLSGSAANCNAHCVSSTITAFEDGDSCCPAGANANQDGDCSPVCGNGVKETGEECDGSADCDSECKLQSTAAYRRCVEALTGVEGDCESCICTDCANEFEACFESGDTSRDTKCATVVNCGLQNNCVGAFCYCGTGTSSPDGTCLPWTANGACKSVIENAAGTSDMLIIFNQQFDMATALGRSTAFTDCHQLACSACD